MPSYQPLFIWDDYTFTNDPPTTIISYMTYTPNYKLTQWWIAKPTEFVTPKGNKMSLK